MGAEGRSHEKDKTQEFQDTLGRTTSIKLNFFPRYKLEGQLLIQSGIKTKSEARQPSGGRTKIFHFA